MLPMLRPHCQTRSMFPRQGSAPPTAKAKTFFFPPRGMDIEDGRWETMTRMGTTIQSLAANLSSFCKLRAHAQSQSLFPLLFNHISVSLVKAQNKCIE